MGSNSFRDAMFYFAVITIILAGFFCSGLGIGYKGGIDTTSICLRDKLC